MYLRFVVTVVFLFFLFQFLFFSSVHRKAMMNEISFNGVHKLRIFYDVIEFTLSQDLSHFI